MRTVNLVYLFFELCPLNIENSHLSHILMSSLFRERLMHLPFNFIICPANFVCGGGGVYCFHVCPSAWPSMCLSVCSSATLVFS